jgi:hypothetical protein
MEIVLIGAIAGAISAAVLRLLDDIIRRRGERDRERQELIGRYLLQLQDSVESLWYRLNNLANRLGGKIVSDQYFKMSMLYALGLVLAYKRILLLDGIYPKLEQLYHGMGDGLRMELQKIDDLLDKGDFFRYERLALAETLLDTGHDFSRAITFVEFQKRCESESVKRALEPAIHLIDGWRDPEDKAEIIALMNSLNTIADLVSAKTRLPKTISRK